MRFLILAIIILLPSYVIRFHIGPFPTTLLEVLLLILFFFWLEEKAIKCFRTYSAVAVHPRAALKAVLARSPSHSEEQNGLNRTASRWTSEHEREGVRRKARRGLYFPILLFIVAGTISIFISPNILPALGLWRAYIIEPILFFIILLDVAKDWKSVMHDVIIALGISALVVSTVAIYQHFIPTGISMFGFTFFAIPHNVWFTETTRRVTSVFGYPNAIGLFLAPITVLLIGYVIGNAVAAHPRADLKAVLAGFPSRVEGQNGLNRTASRWTSEHEREGVTRKARQTTCVLLTLTALASIISMFFAQSEGGLVAVATGLVVLGLLQPHWRRWTVVVVCATILSITIIPSWRQHAVDIVTFRFDSGPIRRSQWNETTRMLLDRPIFGAGLAGYPTVFAPYHHEPSVEVYQYPHNILLNFWSEMGLMGVVSFGWILVYFFRLSLRGPRLGGGRSNLARSPRPATAGLAMTAAMTTLLVHGLVDVPYFKNDLSVFFWLLVALLIIQSTTTDATT